MAGSGGAQICTVHLPLDLETTKQINQNGLQEVVKNLKQHLNLFQIHISLRKDLAFVQVKDVTFESGLIYLIFEFKDEDSLDAFFACTKVTNNKLSECISEFFDEQSYELVAGLHLNSKLTCQLSMSRREYLKAQNDMFQEDSDLPLFRQSGGEQKKDKNISSHYEVITGKSVGLSVKEKAKQYDSSSNTDPKHQPGSYPHKEKDKDKVLSGISDQIKSDRNEKHDHPQHLHTSKNKQGAEDGLTPVLQKQFILYIPPVPKGWKIDKAFMESEKFKILNTDLRTYCGNLYEARIDIPLEHLEHQDFLSFHYVIVLKKTSVIGRFWSSSECVETSKLFYVEASSCHRHIWEQPKPRPTTEEIALGYLEHLNDIMFYCTSNQEFKERCIEIENLCKTSLPKENAIEILKLLAVTVKDKGYYPDSSVLYLIAINRLLTRPELIVNEKLVDVTDALKLLQAIQSHSISSLPSSCRREIQYICYQFCKIALGSNICVLTYLSTCYPFYDEEYILERVESYVTSQVSLCRDSQEMLPFAKNLCSKLYRKAEEASSKTAKTILEKLLRHLPLHVAFHVFACLNRESENLSSRESDVQSVLYGSLSVRMEKMIVTSRKSNDLSRLLTCWKDIEKFKVLAENFKSKYEDAIIQIIETHRGLIESVPDIMSAFIDQFAFFKEQSKQQQLIFAVCKSKSTDTNKLFVSLANNSAMSKLYLQLERDQFKELCLLFVIGNSQLMGREHAFQYVCERLNDIWCMQQIEQRHDFQEVWENILEDQLRKYRLRELLQYLKLIDNLAGANEHLGKIFLRYIKTSLQGNYEGFHPEEIFRWLMGTCERPLVELRISALVLNVLTDTFGHLQLDHSIFEHFMQLVEQCNFWRSLFSCTGTFVDIVRENTNYCSVKQCITEMTDLFKNNEVSYDFVVDIENNTQLCRATKNLLQLECKREVVEKYWSEALMKIKEEKEKLRRVEKVIEVVCSKLKSDDLLEGFMNITKHLTSAEKQFTSGKLTLKECVKSNLIWKGIEQLPGLCEYLETIVQSAIFWNLSLKEVTEELMKTEHPSENEDDPLLSVCLLFEELSIQQNTEHNTAKAIQFLCILSKSGVQIYKEMWSRILNDENFAMKDVFAMFGKRPVISKELDIARRILYCDVSETIVKTLERVYSIDRVKIAVDAMVAVLKAFKVDLHSDAKFSSAVESFEKLKKGAVANYSLANVRDALEVIFSSIEDLQEDTISIIAELGKSTSLIGFLQEIVDEDIRNLIDAVEDISEQQVQESTVSALIEVKRFVQPILIPSSKRTCRELIQIFETQTRSSRGNPSKLPTKIVDCMSHLHNLKSLYNNVANRGEQTKEMIRNIILRGTFVFYLNKENDFVDFEVNYKQNKKSSKETRQRSTLIDLRSRALLLMNTEKKEVGERHFQTEDLSKFVDYINLCLDIAECLFELYSSGYSEDTKKRTPVKPSELNDKKVSLKKTLKNWLNCLQKEREEHFLMNFINGTQIHILYKYLEGDDKDIAAVHTLSKFIHPRMQVKKLREFYRAEKQLFEHWNDNTMLHCLGSTLHSAHSSLSIFERSVTASKKVYTKITDSVKSNRLAVAQLEDGSINTVKTITALYLNTTKRLPEPNQVLFCTRFTSKEEIDLLIRRCLGAESFYQVKPLFCIANVELLPNEMQFELVDALRHLGRDFKYLLALVCRGSRNHPFIDELYEYVTSVTPATDKTVHQIFHEHCSNVLTITSEEAGQGKSQLIHRIAHGTKKGVVTLHISGCIRKSALVEKLLSLNVRDQHLLHIDIGNVEDPTELDTFLFELIVLRFVSAGKLSFSLLTQDIKIEIANTHHNKLRNALQTAMLFSRKIVRWEGIDAFVASKEIDSPTQIVCRYLEGLEKNELDKLDYVVSKSEFTPMSRKRCRQLLQIYVGESFCNSYPVLHTFLNVLADQLKKLTLSSFFRISRLRDMVGSKSTLAVKSKLTQAMIQMSKEFARKSLEACREVQMSTIKAGFENRDKETEKLNVNQVEGMIRWEESNHLVFVFHNQNIQTLTAFYRTLDRVEIDVKFLFESQMKKKMADFSTMPQTNLQSILQRVARTNPLPLPEEKLLNLAKSYALTADNLLKMVLIMLRIKANVPVVVMGETGCGKTSLIRYLAQICEINFDVMNIHAGVSSDEIVSKVHDSNELALMNLNEERWLFLDEINTSESIFMISDVICHHTCLGRELSPNLIVLGACNPYKLRTSKAISTAGLDSKVETDELSRLVYRVLPLPEMLLSYVWDFGSLSEADEKKYIFRMTEDVFPEDKRLHDLLTNLLSVSQAFVRKKESSAYSVSLRDVQRCKQLTKWFMEILPKKGTIKGREKYPCDIFFKAIILSLAHCYHCRFADKGLRKDYREVISRMFVTLEFDFGGEENVDEFLLGVIREEQRDILDRMDLPPGTACNSALQENVFVILVCIFNRIPIFVVGKPGCSKSLAMQLIRSNLRGKDSTDNFFKSLPQLYCVSFQGSESSTSDGIFKVFEKAEKYQISNSREDVLSVVILDEIGLAEISRFNPLKVLHNLLEPDGKSQPNVAVVGISNWSLDASKMNRAIHLSRTDMDVEELFDTAISIGESFLDSEANKSETFFEGYNEEVVVSINDIKKELHGMAEAYFTYIKEMRFKNFHGLRDYYSLVKLVARKFAEEGRELNEEQKAEMIVWGLERNFGGLPAEKHTLHDVFGRHVSIPTSSRHTVIDLITQNIKDTIARHLMLITTGESVLGIIEQKLQEIGYSRIEVIYGSQFEEDLTDDYNYRILSRIILCMEEGVILILKDLESIYGSLYDMLNQNYTMISKKKNCRVALGPYSNPICHVADTFRCIVLIDEGKLDMSDPPFLNRFEKQYLRFFDIIGDSQMRLINDIESWIEDLLPLNSKEHSKHDIFPVYTEDMVASLVLKYDCNRSTSTKLSFETGFVETDLFRECQKLLLWIMKPEMIVQIKSITSAFENKQTRSIANEYFSLPIHGGLGELISFHSEKNISGVGNMSVIFTTSNIHTKVSLGKSQIQVEKLGAFKSEKQLSSKIQLFWVSDECNILVVQCNAKEDGKHLMLTKLVIERCRRDYQRKEFTQQKHVYLVIHLDRVSESPSCVTQLNFLSDWDLIMLDSINCPQVKLPELCSMTLLEAIQQKRPLHDCLKEELFWAFTRIKYGRHSRDITSLTNIISKMENSPEFLEMLDNEMWTWIWKNKSGEQDKNWQSTVACNVTLLNTSTSFVHALETFILSVIKIPLAKFIYKMELSGIIDCFFRTETRYMLNGSEIENMVEKRKVFISLLNYEDVFSIDDIPNETGPECYTCHTYDLSLEMPFIMFIFESIEETKDEFLETVRLYRIQCLLDEDEELPEEVYEEVLCQQENHILQKMPDMERFLYRMWGEDYFDDFCNICSNSVCPSMPKLLRTRYTKFIMTQHTPIDYDDPFRFVLRLHTTIWVHFSMYRAEMMLIEACLKVVPNIEPDIDNALSKVSKLKYDKVEKRAHDIPIDEIDEFDDSVEPYEFQVISDQRKSVRTKNIKVAPEDAQKLDIIITTEYPDSSEELERSETVEFQANETEISDTNVLQKSNSMHVMEEIRDNYDKLQERLSEDKERKRENEVDYKDPYLQMSLPDDTPDIPKEYKSDTFSSRFEESLSSQDCLVQFLCKKMIPTTSTIEYHGGVHQWYSKVSCTLTLAYQVTRSPKLLFSLRVCTELAATFIIPFSLEDLLLQNLGNLLNDDFELDSKEVFETIGVIFDTALNCKISDEQLVSQACAKMLSSYLIMCISSEPETRALDFLFTMITNDSISADDIHLLKAPLCLSFSLIDRHMFLNLLQKEPCYESDSESESVYEESEVCDLFDKLDKTLTSLNDPNSSQGKFIVLVVDLFQELYADCFVQEESDENEDTMSHCRKKSNDLDMIFLASHKLLREKVNGIRNVAAVAFVKAYVDDFAYHYQEEEIDNCEDILDVVLADECDETISERLRLYFLKALVREKTFCYLQRFLKTNQSKFKFLQQVDWTDGYFDQCLEKSPLCLFTNEEMHKTALCKLNLDLNTYKEAVENTVAKAATGITSMINLLSVLVEGFYLSRFTFALDDTKRTKATMILNEVIGQIKEGKVIHFIKCLTGEQNFSFDVFNLTEESKEKDFYKVSFCTTLYALGTGHSHFTERNDASVLIQCLCFPADFKNSILPGFPNDDDINVSKQCTESDDVTFAICPCGNILAFFKDTKCDKCSICNSNLKPEKIAKEESDHKELKCGLLLSDVTVNQLGGVRGLQPASYHILQLLTKACLLGAVAVSPMELTNILHLFDVPENEICNTLWKTIVNHWEILCELLGVEDNVLFVLLQAVVSNTLDLLFKVEAPSSSKALLSWEERFESVISSVVDKRFQYVKETIEKHDSLHEYTNPPVEQHFLEVDNEKDVLYRVISVPCKKNFLSQLYPYRDKFPVLSLILNNEQKMELPQHILNIVNWHKATIANSNYMLKKSECLKMTVQDFIYHKHERGNKQANDVWDRFESFRESWEYLMEHINVKDIVSKMKRIHSESKMSECLLIDKSSIIYTVLQTLVEIQNNLIIEMLALTKDSAALQFLLRDINVAVVRSVPLISIKEEELFACNINWSDLLRQESQSDLRYGHGRYINYDFSSIEQSIAVETLSRKAYIQMSESLPKIMFIDELHKNYSSLIRQLKVNIRQDPLPSEIVNGIKSRKEEDPRMATELLTHLGIVMSLLKKTNGDPERPLVAYVDGWKSLLTHSFPKKLLPNPETSVKLCHVVALSELLEEICAESVKNALSDYFRCKLDGPLVEHILKTVKDDTLATIFLKALKRFTFRCLSSQTATSSQSLREYLSDDTFWPDGCLIEGRLVLGDKQLNLSEVVPDGLMVRHTFACLTTIEKELEKRRQECMKLTTFASSFKTKVKSSQNEKMAEKKRKASKYRKF